MNRGNKQRRALSLLAGGVVILGAALAVVWFCTKPAEEAVGESFAEDLKTVSVVPETITQLSKMVVINQEDTYTIVPDGDAYRVEELDALPQDLTLVRYVAESTFELTTSSEIGEVEDLNEYGLQNPVIHITLTFENGDQKTLYLGNTVPFDESSRYFSTPDSRCVYVVKVDEHLAEGREAYVSTRVIRSDSEGGDDYFDSLTLSGSDFPEKLVIERQDGVYRMTAPVSAAADEAQVTYAAVQLSGLTAQEAVAVRPSAEMLSAFGFDRPRTELEATLNGVYYHIKVSSKNATTDYVLVEGMDVVYEVLRSNISAWANTSRLTLQNKSVSDIGLEQVAELRYQSGETSFSLTVTRAEDDSRSTEDKTYYTYQAVLDGVPVDTGLYQAFVNAAAALTIAEHQLPANGQAETTITWKNFEDSGHTLELIPAENGLMQAVLDGSQMGLVRQSAVENIRSAAARLFTGSL